MINAPIPAHLPKKLKLSHAGCPKISLAPISLSSAQGTHISVTLNSVKVASEAAHEKLPLAP